MQRSNRDTIAALGEVAVATFAQLTGPDPAGLASAGAAFATVMALAGHGCQQPEAVK